MRSSELHAFRSQLLSILRYAPVYSSRQGPHLGIYIAAVSAVNLSGSHSSWATFSTIYHNMVSSLQLHEPPKISSTLQHSQRRCELSEFGDWGPTFHLTASHLRLDYSPVHLDAMQLSSSVRDRVQAIINRRQLGDFSWVELPQTKWTSSYFFVGFTPGDTVVELLCLDAIKRAQVLFRKQRHHLKAMRKSHLGTSGVTSADYVGNEDPDEGEQTSINDPVRSASSYPSHRFARLKLKSVLRPRRGLVDRTRKVHFIEGDVKERTCGLYEIVAKL